MSNNFDSAIILDTGGVAGDYIGFERLTGSASTKARIYNAPSLAAVNGVLTAPRGSIALCDDGTIAQNTDAATAWSQVGVTEQTIADPGNAGAIPVTASGSVAIVTAGAETRTLAIPTFVGQQLWLFMQTDGGNAVITVASPINAAGNNTVTFADVTDTLLLKAINNGGTLAWRVISSDGAALSTV